MAHGIMRWFQIYQNSTVRIRLKAPVLSVLKRDAVEDLLLRRAALHGNNIIPYMGVVKNNTVFSNNFRLMVRGGYPKNVFFRVKNFRSDRVGLRDVESDSMLSS
jgi:hypothetical protein